MLILCTYLKITVKKKRRIYTYPYHQIHVWFHAQSLHQYSHNSVPWNVRKNSYVWTNNQKQGIKIQINFLNRNSLQSLLWWSQKSHTHSCTSVFPFIDCTQHQLHCNTSLYLFFHNEVIKWTYSGLPLLKKGSCKIPAGKATTENIITKNIHKYSKKKQPFYECLKLVKHGHFFI